MRRGRTAWIVGLLAASAIATLLPITLGRYRLEALPFLCLAAAQALRLTVIMIRLRRWSGAALHAGAIGGVAVFLFWSWPPSWLRPNFRQSLQLMDRNISMDVYGSQRRFVRAADEAAELAAAAKAIPGAAQEALQTRRDEIICLVFGMIDAIRAGDNSQADALQSRATRRVFGGPAERRFSQDELAGFLGERFPQAIAEQLAEVLLAPTPTGAASH